MVLLGYRGKSDITKDSKTKPLALRQKLTNESVRQANSTAQITVYRATRMSKINRHSF